VQLAIRRTPWLITGLFCLVVMVSGWGLWSAFVHQPTRIAIAIDNPLLVEGTQGVDQFESVSRHAVAIGIVALASTSW
jgi:hypothetical protein